MSPQTQAILDVLMNDPAEWRYGYDLSRATGLKSGTLYPILIRLTDRGWLEHEWRVELGEKPRHMYRLTAHGRAAARLQMKAHRAALNPINAR